MPADWQETIDNDYEKRKRKGLNPLYPSKMTIESET